LRLDAEDKKIEDSAIPAKLDNLLSRLKSNSANLPLALRAWQLPTAAGPAFGGEDLPRSGVITGWQFEERIPAIVHPIFHRRKPFHSGNALTPSSRNPVDWIVIVLNVDTIRDRILPDLARRYFAGQEGLEYKVALVAAEKPPRVIYSSDSGFGSGGHEFDSSMSLFGPPPGSVEGHRLQPASNGSGLHGEEWRNFSAPVWFPVIQYTAQDQPWKLLLQHRTNSVEDVARSVWHKNLIIGGVVLLLLAANMALIAVASYRANKFAQLQMEFVASVSHELRTPLAAIFSAGENIKDGFVEGKPNLMYYGSIITGQARQLIDLVDRILLFSSTRGGKNQYVFRPHQVSEILQTVRKNTAALVEGAGVTVEQQVQPGLPPVTGDLAALSSCLQNLVTNAVKYGGTDRWIRLSAELDRTAPPHGEIRISVEDHGIGINNFELPHVFEPFYRSPRVIAAQIHGTGLGLAVARRLAEAMGGRLSVRSEVGVGSVFTLHLPVGEDRNQPSVPERSATKTVISNE
ncbi:MAG TPA: HAMP domain-containing sensor histidine kinase, partial [Terriglobales bacterium]